MTISSDDEDLEERISYPQSFGFGEEYDDIIEDETIKIEISAKSLDYHAENLSGELLFEVYRKRHGEEDRHYRKVYSESSDVIKLISNKFRRMRLENLIDDYVHMLSNKYCKEKSRDRFIPQKVFYDIGDRLAANLAEIYVKYLNKKSYEN